METGTVTQMSEQLQPEEHRSNADKMAEPESTSSTVPSEPPPPYTAAVSPPVQHAQQPPPYSPPNTDPNKDSPYREGYPPQNATYGATPYDPKTGTGDAPPPYAGEAPGATYLSTSTSMLITREKKPPTYFLLSLLTCLCFSPLFGLLAIIFSALSDTAWNSGDHASSRRYSQVALSVALVGIITSVLIVILVFVTGIIHVG